jgi:hypothetical protein
LTGRQAIAAQAIAAQAIAAIYWSPSHEPADGTDGFLTAPCAVRATASLEMDSKKAATSSNYRK